MRTDEMLQVQDAHDRQQEIVKTLLAALQEITDLCKREPANPFLADDMDRVAAAAIAKVTKP